MTSCSEQTSGSKHSDPAPANAPSRNEVREARSLKRRLEVVRLPVIALRRHGYLNPSVHDIEWRREPIAAGIGPDGVALAVWTSHTSPTRKLITTHVGGTDIITSTLIDSPLHPGLVQPLPGGRFLLAAARTRPDRDHSAEVWNSDSTLHTIGTLGDAIEQLLTTPSGQIWAGYFDEAMTGNGPQTRGLVRYTPDLAVDWLYPAGVGLPQIFDSCALNVAVETAHCYAYPKWHLLSVDADQVDDHGPVPYHGADAIVLDGDNAAMIGGFASEYDLITPLRMTADGIELTGTVRRLVLPDGMEVRSAAYTCRGPDLHVIIRGSWYRVNLDDMLG